MKTVIGKNTLGGGKKMVTSLTNYNRSTHDLSFVMRTTMAPGVLVPTMKLLMEPGDTFDIDARYHTLTHPTIGPLFGSFKQQNDYFFCPIRLYNAMLHNNTLNVGLDMSKVKLPKIKWKDTTKGGSLTGSAGTLQNNVNPSSLLAYMGYRSLFYSEKYTNLEYEWQCVPILAYYDIFKNYYANKQEQAFYTIGGQVSIGPMTKPNEQGYALGVINIEDWSLKQSKLNGNIIDSDVPTTEAPRFAFFLNTADLDANSYFIKVRIWAFNAENIIEGNIGELIKQGKLKRPEQTITNDDAVSTNGRGEWIIVEGNGAVNGSSAHHMQIYYITGEVKYLTYQLESIDNLREYILSQGRKQVYINQSNAPFIQDFLNNEADGAPACKNPMAGLCLKTYQSDINNNWVKTEWIDGDNGINEITSIDTSKGSFSIDQLNLAEKVYKMLNRIAVSDGTYNAWIQTIFTSGGLNHIETPIYLGGQSQEIEFQEVVSQSSTDTEPLGSLAGRGAITQRKGSRIKFKADEPGYIICITSLTPRVDYFQGNEWDIYLENLDQLHKPQLDGIGFQDRLYRNINAQVGASERIQSIGKQPAWIEYMTNVNKTFGNFALIENEGWMCLNRIYDSIRTYTTYVQPHMYNNIFAETEVSAQNFWVQIAFNIKARRVMSAKQIPNL